MGRVVNGSDVLHYLRGHGTTEIACARCYELHPCTSWDSSTPGLVVVDTTSTPCARPCERPYSITHARSGLLVAAAETIDQALEVAADLAAVPGIDWLASAEDVHAATRCVVLDMVRLVLGECIPSGDASVGNVPGDVRARYEAR